MAVAIDEALLRMEIDRLETQLHEAKMCENSECEVPLIRSVLNIKYTRLAALLTGKKVA